MKSHYVPFAARIRRYKHLAKRLNRLLKSGTFCLLPEVEQQKLLQKLRQRLKAIGHLFPQQRLRESLAGIALLLSTALANPLEAQVFQPPVAAPFGLAEGQINGYPTFADIDGDGDMDLFMVSYDNVSYEQTLLFYENTGTPEAPAFSADAFEVNPFGVQMPSYVTTAVLADLDDDGDQDLLLGTYYGSGFYYFENVGTAVAPSFAPSQNNPFGLTADGQIQVPTLADLDNDGDLDLLSAKEYAEILFYENTGTAQSPAFAAPTSNPFGIVPPFAIVTFPVLADLDNDGDQDVLMTAYYPGTEFYFVENTGSPEAPAFGSPQASPFGLELPAGSGLPIPAVADIDNDGDLDVFLHDYEYLLTYYFENSLIDIQQPPTAQNSAIDAVEDEPYSFTGTDFNFMDGNLSDQLSTVRIVSLPASGALQLNGTAVAAAQEIDAADLPSLSFEALPDENGSPYTSFSFQVSDGTDWSVDEYIMTINVSPVNDAPVAENAEIDILSNETYTFAATDFPFSDVDGGDLQAVQLISLVDRGVLQVNGTNATVNQVVPLANLGQLTFQPVFNEAGTPYTSFDFKVSDGTVYSDESFTMTINVTPPNATKGLLLDASLVLSPNPAGDFIELKIEAVQILGDLNVTIFDETGRTVSALRFGKQGNAFQQSLEVKDFAPGVYWINVESGGKYSAVKFVKL